MTETAISFAVVTLVGESLARLVVSAGEASLVLPDGSQYRAQDVTFDGSSQQATWSGTMAPAAGAGQAATITISC